ncbi:unnamed protein product [Symbiodinium sp. CCMP2456]|nr:unnamed protein product [Symbiodinium sp. CCMP2456]
MARSALQTPLSSLPSELRGRTPSRGNTPMMQVEEPLWFPPIPADRAGCLSGIQFRAERRAQEFVHPFIPQTSIYAGRDMFPRQAVPGYSGFIVRSTDTNMLSRPYAKGNWEAELWPFDMIQSVINRSTA